MDTAPRELNGYPVRVRTFCFDGDSVELLGPANFEELIDDPRVAERFARDEYLPYWAEFWPACLLLAERVCGWPRIAPSERRPRVLEFGCGLGLAALVAAQRGYDVVASDYDDDALAFVRASAELNGIPTPETRFVDWRERYPDLVVDRVIAAEVLYEQRNLHPIAAFLSTHLAASGEALIVDGNRSVADGFAAAADEHDLLVGERALPDVIAPSGDLVRGRLYTVQHKNILRRGAP